MHGGLLCLTDYPSGLSFRSIRQVPLTVNETFAALTGTGWIDVAEIRVGETQDPVKVTWIDDTHWEADLPLQFGTQELTLRAFDRGGVELGTATIVATSTKSDRPLEQYLRVSGNHVQSGRSIR